MNHAVYGSVFTVQVWQCVTFLTEGEL